MARATVAVGLTVFVVWRSDAASVGAAVAGAHVAWLAASVALVLVDRSLMAYRWIVLVRVFEPPDRLPLAAIVRVFFVSSFVGTFLPASVGGDAVRAWGLARERAGGAASVASVLMDRLLGVVGLLLVTLAGLGLAADLLRDSVVVTSVALVALACAAAFAAVYSQRVAAALARLLALVPLAAIRRMAFELTAAVRAYATRHGALANVLAGSIAVQLLRIVQAYALGRSIDITAPLATYVAFIPLILLVMLLPISIYGLGTSQLAFAALFARAGVAADEAVALSLLFVGLGLVGNLPGAFIYASGKPRPAGGPAATRLP
jgi:uncharacterized protein (TIRG00374 family)